MVTKSPLLKKLKTLEIQKRYVVLAVILALIIRFWGENSVTLLQKDVPIVTDPVVSLDEVTRYIQTKQEYLNENIAISPDILASRDLENYLDKETHEWFLVRNWRPKRFFYVEERIKFILSYVLARKAQQERADALEQEAQSILDLNPIVKGQKIPSERIHATQMRHEAGNIRRHLNQEIRDADIWEEEGIFLELEE